MPLPPPSEELSPLLTSPNILSTSLATPALAAASRTKLQGRRYLSPETPLRSLESEPSSPNANHSNTAASGNHGDQLKPSTEGYVMSEKALGKRRARGDEVDHARSPAVNDLDEDEGISDDILGAGSGKGRREGKTRYVLGRKVTVMFANAGDGEGGNLELWIEDGQSVASVKEQIRHLRPALAPNSLKLIHAGRLLTDGILLLPWLRSLEERVRRQASGMGGDVEEVLKDVGLADEGDGDEEGGRGKTRGESQEAKVFLHCTVGGKEGEVDKRKEDDEPTAPRRRGFDVLLDAGLSQADVAQMRRQFYESRGEEVPEGLERGDLDDEHARALEEQWIEGDLTADTATTSSEGMYSSILNGLLTGFLFPILPMFFFREVPLPNFFDAEAEARGEPVTGGVAENSIGSGLGEVEVASMISQRVQVGVMLGIFVNFAFGALRFVN